MADDNGRETDGSPPLSSSAPMSHMLSTVSRSVTDPANSGDLEAPLMRPKAASPSWGSFLNQFLWLGWTAFGGPAAHIGFFQKLFVERSKWLSTGVFVELLALGQCLPGPTSTQMAFAIGVSQKGVLGGLASGFLFLYPGLLLMSAVGLGAANFLKNPSPAERAVVAGLAVTGVALVASAAKDLMTKVCATKVLALICAGSAAIAYYHNTAWLFPTLLLGGAAVTIAIAYWSPAAAPGSAHVQEEQTVEKFGLGRVGGALLIAVWAAILFGAMALRRVYSYSEAAPLHWFELFYRTGSLIFGGGQVVLPLLLGEIVQYDCSDPARGCVESPDSWCTEADFYAGLAAAQAMPGPLFNFAAYLGAVVAMRAGYSTLLGIALCWAGLFAPGIMLIFGVLPFWSRFRHWDLYRKALPGLNSSAIGLIVSAVITMVFSVTSGSSPFPKAGVAIGIVGFAAVDILDVPAPLSVLFGGVLGLVAYLLHLQ